MIAVLIFILLFTIGIPLARAVRFATRWTGFSGAAVSIAILLAAGCASTTEGASHHPRGVVSAATPEAAAAGVEILDAGGNAADAAVAAAFVLAVSEPAGSGIGGQAMVILDSPTMEPAVILGSTRAPSRIPHPTRAEDLSGRRASTVPSFLRVMDRLWRDFGSGRVPWRRILEPAIRIAERGYVVGDFRHRVYRRYAAKLRRDEETARIFLGPDGRIPEVGSVIRQPALGRTLRRVADAGPDDFYTGELAREIAEDHSRHGGWIRLSDLEGFAEVPVVAPLKATYRGWSVYTLPPPAGGWVVLQALRLLEAVPAHEIDPEAPERWVWHAEVLRASHASRRSSPVPDLKDYLGAVEERIGEGTVNRIRKAIAPPGSGETTHLSVADGSGMVVGITQSLNSFFGSRVAHPKLGFLYNDYMREFDRKDAGSPYHLRGEGMPYSSMSATILARDGVPHLVLGSPGSGRIISAVVQVVTTWVGARGGIARAVSLPRIHPLRDGTLCVEGDGPPAGILLALERRGFRVERRLTDLGKGGLDPYFGGVHAVAWEGDRWIGAADPRRDGQVAAIPGG